MQPEIEPDTLTFRSIISVSNGTATISSTTVAELFEKQHKHVLETIRGFETGTDDGVNGPVFRPVEYQDSKGEMRPAYQMNRDGFFFLTLGFTGKKAEVWRWRVIKAFNAMEDELRRFQAAGLRLDSPTLVDALFKGQVSIFTAKQIQSLPEEEQEQILEMPKKEIIRAVKEMRQAKTGTQAALAGLTGNNEWYTPSEWIERARQVMRSIDVDPASNAVAQNTVQASEWYDQERDGLQQEWHGNVWLNPPYARGLIEAFVERLLEQYQTGNTQQAIVLVDNRTDTRWFQQLCSAASAVAFTKGRVNFYNETVESSSPANGSAFIYLGQNSQAFRQAFESHCLVLFTIHC
ncbi:MAG: Rha family transcriptional regulator [Magnetococcales bacterium]|nr:Rha family transcriptional regulator [Magnetococcales bacterium]